jgi:REP element-mobilizing transposase RayT
MNRGTGGQDIFRSDRDRKVFLEVVGEACEASGVEVHSYSLLTTHYHLLVHTPTAGLSVAMRHIGGMYSKRFGEAHGRRGVLFERRFHSVHIATQSQLLQTLRYIDLNPVEAGIAATPENHRWSSFGSYVGAMAAPRWLRTDTILNALGSAEQYRVFVHSKVEEPLAG